MAKPAQSILGVLCVAALISLPGIQVAQQQVAAEPILAMAAPRAEQLQLEPSVSAGPQSTAEPADVVRAGDEGRGRGGPDRPTVTKPATSTGQADNGKWLWPTPSKLITSPFGYRSDPFNGGSAFHSGIDFGDRCGTGTGATRPGTVTFAGPAGGYGLRVVVSHENGMSSSYSHLQAIAVSVGTKVEQGQLVGDVGTTGRSTGCHLHFEIMINGAFTDPLPYLQGNPAANPPAFGNGNVDYTPISDPSQSPSSSPSTSTSRPTDPCEISDDPQDAADSGGLIPVGPAPSASASPKASTVPCTTPTPVNSGTPSGSASSSANESSSSASSSSSEAASSSSSGTPGSSSGTPESPSDTPGSSTGTPSASSDTPRSSSDTPGSSAAEPPASTPVDETSTPASDPASTAFESAGSTFSPEPPSPSDVTAASSAAEYTPGDSSGSGELVSAASSQTGEPNSTNASPIEQVLSVEPVTSAS